MTPGTETRLAAVIGRPIGHSLSPLIHNAWLAEAGIDAAYLAFAPEDEAAFETLIAGLWAGGALGVNVTAPFKGAAYDWAGRAGAAIGPEARAAGSVNLLLFSEAGVRAESTDGAGMLGAVRDQAPDLDLNSGPVVVLGAGGAGRAAVHALKTAGASDIRVVNRTLERAEVLAAVTQGVTAWPLETAATALDRSHLLINAASTLDPPDLEPMASGGAVLDMTYRPLETPILKRAKERGLTPVDGLAMLIGQARPSFEALFGRAAPTLDVRALALRALESTR